MVRELLKGADVVVVLEQVRGKKWRMVLQFAAFAIPVLRKARFRAFLDRRSVQVMAPRHGLWSHHFDRLCVASPNGWFVARPSGTESIDKIYAESF